MAVDGRDRLRSDHGPSDRAEATGQDEDLDAGCTGQTVDGGQGVRNHAQLSRGLSGRLARVGFVGDRAGEGRAGRAAVQGDAHRLLQQAQRGPCDRGLLIEIVDLSVAEGRLFEAVGTARYGSPMDALEGSGLFQGGEVASDGFRGDVEIGGQIGDIDPARFADQLSDASLPFFSEHVRPFPSRDSSSNGRITTWLSVGLNDLRTLFTCRQSRSNIFPNIPTPSSGQTTSAPERRVLGHSSFTAGASRLGDGISRSGRPPR